MKFSAFLILMFIGHLHSDKKPVYYSWNSEGPAMMTSSVIQLNKGNIKIHSFPMIGGMESLEIGTYESDKKTNRLNSVIKETYSFSHNTGMFGRVEKNCNYKKDFQFLDENKLQEINLNETKTSNLFNWIYIKSEDKKTISQMKVATDLFKKYNGSPYLNK